MINWLVGWLVDPQERRGGQSHQSLRVWFIFSFTNALAFVYTPIMMRAVRLRPVAGLQLPLRENCTYFFKCFFLSRIAWGECQHQGDNSLTSPLVCYRCAALWSCTPAGGELLSVPEFRCLSNRGTIRLGKKATRPSPSGCPCDPEWLPPCTDSVTNIPSGQPLHLHTEACRKIESGGGGEKNAQTFLTRAP